jgi:UDP-N-acetyl-D-glucosamine dehydrogenase
MSPLESLKSRIAAQQAVVAVVGLGYVGLPLVDAFFRAGFQLIGYDVDQEKIDKLNRGESYIGHIPSEQLQQWLAAKGFEATSDVTRLAEADAILVCVPTPLTESRDPDLSYVVSTFQALAKVLRPGQLLVLESTTYPGTTRDVVLQELATSGLRVGATTIF